MMLPLSHWPATSRRGLRGVLTDIDDTLTHRGSISPQALEALGDLKAAGLSVIAITGRPIAWCAKLLDGNEGPPWPVDAVVAENGGAAYIMGHKGPSDSREPLSKIYQLDAAQRAVHRARMDAIAQEICAALPGVEQSQDSAGRETDLAFDYAEFARHSPDTVKRVLALLQRHGMQTAVSSIHIHGCFGHFNKWTGACWIVRELMGRELAQELDHWAFVGDSGNDEVMFERFVHSVGVANIARWAAQLQFLPRYVAPSEYGAGFAEVARAILGAQDA
jgi:HAD superfamily hydrolase (TIGR01484 family)